MTKNNDKDDLSVRRLLLATLSLFCSTIGLYGISLQLGVLFDSVSVTQVLSSISCSLTGATLSILVGFAAFYAVLPEHKKLYFFQIFAPTIIYEALYSRFVLIFFSPPYLY